MAKNEIVIEEFDEEKHSIENITDLLHRAYERLLKMGLHFWATAQSNDITLGRLKSGIGFVARTGTKIVGTIHCCPV